LVGFVSQQRRVVDVLAMVLELSTLLPDPPHLSTLTNFVTDDPDRNDLIAFQRGGDRGTLAAIWQRHADEAWRLARWISGERAEDALQEAALQFVRAAPRWRDGEPGSTGRWLMAIIANAARKERRRGRRRWLPLTEVGELPEPSKEPQDQLRQEQVRQALARLAPRHRLAVELRYLVGLGFPAVAAALGVGERTARTRVSRGLDQLRRLLGVEVPTGSPEVVLLLSPPHLPAAPAAIGILVDTVPPATALATTLPMAKGTGLATTLWLTGGALALAAVWLAPWHLASGVHPAPPSTATARAADATTHAVETATTHMASPSSLQQPQAGGMTGTTEKPVREEAGPPDLLAQPITMDTDKIPLRQVLSELSRSTHVHIRLEESEGLGDKRISVHFRTRPLRIACAEAAEQAGAYISFVYGTDEIAVVQGCGSPGGTSPIHFNTVEFVPAPPGSPSLPLPAGLRSETCSNLGSPMFLPGHGYDTRASLTEVESGGRLLLGIVANYQIGTAGPSALGSSQGADPRPGVTTLGFFIGNNPGSVTIRSVIDDKGWTSTFDGLPIDLHRGNILLVSHDHAYLLIRQVDVDLGPCEPAPPMDMLMLNLTDPTDPTVPRSDIISHLLKWALRDPRALAMAEPQRGK
jgi:RNA polymerase sigma factor (sigma-70 family)